MIGRAGTLRRFRIKRAEGIFHIDIPGFKIPWAGGLLFLLLAIPLGLSWGRRCRVFLAIQLTSQSTAAAVCSRVLRRPFISLATTGGPVSEMRYVRESRTTTLRRWLLRRASFLLGQTETAALELRELVGETPVRVLSNPVELVERPVLTNAHRALFVGRFSQEKDLQTLLAAWSSTLKEFPDAELFLVGAGGSYRSVESELRDIVSKDAALRASVTFTGWVTDVSPFMSMCDVYVLPSLSEGMSNSLLEACAFGRVVIASNIPGNEAVLGSDYPLLFPAGDTDALTNVLRRAFNDPALRRRAVAIAVDAATKRSLDVVITELEAVINDASPSVNV